MATTHIWFLNPCLGPNRPGAGQAASPAWAASEAGGAEGLERGPQPLPGPRSPGAEGDRDRGLPGRRRGGGRPSPEFPPLDTWVWQRLPGTAPSGRGRPGSFPDNYVIPVGRGGASPPHRAVTQRPSGRFPFGICVAASWVNESKDGEAGGGALEAGALGWGAAWLGRRIQAGGGRHEVTLPLANDKPWASNSLTFILVIKIP